jgi:hypothetical protein
MRVSASADSMFGHGKPIEWAPAMGIVRIALLPNPYLDREHLAVGGGCQFHV